MEEVLHLGRLSRSPERAAQNDAARRLLGALPSLADRMMGLMEPREKQRQRDGEIISSAMSVMASAANIAHPGDADRRDLQLQPRQPYGTPPGHIRRLRSPSRPPLGYSRQLEDAAASSRDMREELRRDKKRSKRRKSRQEERRSKKQKKESQEESNQQQEDERRHHPDREFFRRERRDHGYDETSDHRDERSRGESSGHRDERSRGEPSGHRDEERSGGERSNHRDEMSMIAGQRSDHGHPGQHGARHDHDERHKDRATGTKKKQISMLK